MLVSNDSKRNTDCFRKGNTYENKKNICANFRGEKKILWVLEEIFDILNKSLIILMQAYASCTLRKNVL